MAVIDIEKFILSFWINFKKTDPVYKNYAKVHEKKYQEELKDKMNFLTPPLIVIASECCFDEWQNFF